MLAGPGEQQTQGEMRLEIFGIGCGSSAIVISGVGNLVEGFLGEAEIIKEMGVGGIFGYKSGKQFDGGRKVVLVESVVGLLAERVLLGGCLGFRSGGIGGSGRKLGMERPAAEEAKKY